MVSIRNEIVINKPILEVSNYAADPNNSTKWCKKVISIQWKTAKPIQLNSKIAYKSKFLGQLISYSYEVVFFEENKKLMLKIKEGLLPLSTTFSWNSIDENTTIMTITTIGKPKMFSTILSPFASVIMKQRNKKDLKKLKDTLENK